MTGAENLASPGFSFVFSYTLHVLHPNFCLDCPAFCVLSLLNVSLITDMGLVYKTRQILQERDTISAYYSRLMVGDVLYVETSYYSFILF
jgi:hypothetical protein